MKIRLYGICVLCLLIATTYFSVANTSLTLNQSKAPPAEIPTPQIEVWYNWIDRICCKITFQTTAGQCVDNISLYQDGVRKAIWYNEPFEQHLVFEICFEVNSFNFFVANFSIEVFQQWVAWRIDRADISVLSGAYLFITIGALVSSIALIYWGIRTRRLGLIVQVQK